MPEIRLQDYVAEIKEMIRSIRLDEAIAHSQYILRHYPKHIESYCLLGEACLEKQMYREAIEFFQRTLGADPENLIARVGLSVIYDEQGAFPEAIWQLERAFELVPGNAEVRRELLRLYSQYAKIDRTRLRLTRGALGRLYSRNGLYERAISEFRAVLRQDPELPDIRVALIEALWREGRQVEVVELCLDLLDDLPNCLKANLILGDIWLRGGDEESAHQRLSAARELDPENIVAQELMGKDSPLPPEEVLISKLDVMPDELGAAPADVTVAETVVAEEEVEGPWDADEELPDWLRDVGVTTEEPDVDMAAEQAVVLEPSPDEDLPTEEMPEWLQEVMGDEPSPPAGEVVTEGELLEEEPVEEAEPEPLAEPESPWITEEEPEPAEAEVPDEEMPEWLQELVGQAEEVAAPLAAKAHEEPPEIEEAPEPLGAPVEELEVAAPPAAEVHEEAPAIEEEAPLVEEVPAWLRDLDAAEVEEVAAPPVAEVHEEAPVIEEEPISDDELPAWLRDLGVTEVEENDVFAEPSTAEVETVEISALPEVEQEDLPVADEEVPVIDQIPDWLRDLDEAEVEEVAAPPEVPASLRALVEAGLLDEADLESAMAEMSAEELAVQRAEEVPSWLRDLVEEEETAAPEKEPAPGEPFLQEIAIPVTEVPAGEEPSLEESVAEAEPEPEAEITFEEPVVEAAEAEPELVMEEIVAEAEPELALVVEEAEVEVVEAEPALVIEEAEVEAVEAEPALVVEEAEVEVAEPEPALVVEEAEVEVLEPEPALVIEEAEIEAVEPEPALVIEEAGIEVAEPEPVFAMEEAVAEAEPQLEAEIAIEEPVVEAAEPEPEAVTEEPEEESEEPSRLDELLNQLKRRPRDYSARLELARLHYAEQDWDRALASYEKLISARRFLPDVVDDLESLVGQDLEQSRIYHMLGDAYMQQDQLDEALEMYRLARQKLTRR